MIRKIELKMAVWYFHKNGHFWQILIGQKGQWPSANKDITIQTKEGHFNFAEQLFGIPKDSR